MDAFIGEIRAFGFNYTPQDWAACNGAAMPINQNPALYSLIGTRYGGDGIQTFKTPNLQGRVPMDAVAPTAVAVASGVESVVLDANHMASHTHTLSVGVGTAPELSIATAQSNLSYLQGVSGTKKYFYNWAAAATPLVAMATTMVTYAGSTTPAAHENRQPYLGMNFCICLMGEYPINPN